jgi:hypothetical protein
LLFLPNTLPKKPVEGGEVGALCPAKKLPPLLLLLVDEKAPNTGPEEVEDKRAGLPKIEGEEEGKEGEEEADPKTEEPNAGPVVCTSLLLK